MKNKQYTSTKVACYTGYFVQAIINNLAPLFYVTFQNEFNISYTKISCLILVNFLSQLVVDISSVKIVPKLGYRVSIVTAHIFSAVGLISLGILPRAFDNHFVGLIIPIIIYAVGSGLIEVLISPLIESLPTENKSGEMSLLHSFYCWGQMSVVLFSTIIIKVIGSSNWIYLPVIWSIVPIVNMISFTKVPIFTPVADGEKEMSVRELFGHKEFIISALVMTGSGASEISVAQWASTFAEKSLGVNKLTGDLLGPCLFALLMGTGRVIYGFIGDRIDTRKILMICSAGCAISYMIISLSPVALISLVGCGLCGIFASVMWPGVLSLGARLFPFGGTAMYAILAMFGDLGCAFGPWVTGFMSDIALNSDRISLAPLNFGLLICSAFPTLMFIFLATIKTNFKGKVQ